MASFLDKTPDFNPYVQQLPIDAMLGVGTQKQQQYNEGIQRIQSHIDNVAGMDVVRDIDKQYLQSKLNGLGNKLKVLSAGDFSDFQLQNTSMGMVTELTKDSNVVNAVVSTQRYRKGLEQMEQYQKEGKTSPSNDWYFQKEVNNWLGSQDIKSSFNSTYQPYTNYKQNALNVIKSLTKDSNITEDAFTFDSKGNIVIADAIVRKSMAGISPQKIQEAMMASLTPADFKQMEIDGMYQYSNVPDQEFVNRINTSYSKEYQYYADMKKVMQGAMSLTKSVPYKDELENKITDIDKKLNSLKSEYDSISSSFASGNTDAAKAQLHSSNFIEQFSKAFSFTETSSTYENSPFAEAQRWRDDMSWKKQSFWMKFNQDEKHHNEKLKADKEAKETEQGYGSFPKAIDQSLLPEYSASKLEEDIETQTTNLARTEDDFIRTFLGKDQVTLADQQWLDNQYVAYLERPSNVENDLRSYFSQRDAEYKKIKSDAAALKAATLQVEKEFPSLSQSIPDDVDGITIRTPNGREIDFEPEDIVNLNYKINRLKVWDRPSVPTGPGSRIGTSFKYDEEKAKQELNSNELYLFNIMKKGGQSRSSLNAGEEVVYSTFQDAWEKVNVPYSDMIKQKNEKRDEIIRERMTVNQGNSYTIPTFNPEQKGSFQSVLVDVLDEAKKKGGIANSENLDIEVLEQLISDPNIRATITVAEGGMMGTQRQEPLYNLNISGGAGTTEFRLSETQKRSVFGDRFEADPLKQEASPYLEQIRKMGGKSTAYDGNYKTTKENSYLTPLDFPNTKIYGVTGNIVTMDGGNSYSLKVNIYNPVSGKWKENIDILDQKVKPEILPQVMKRLSDEAIFQLLYERAPTKEDLKKIEESAKKPL